MPYRVLHNLSNLFPSAGAFYYSRPCSNCPGLTSRGAPEHTQVPTAYVLLTRKICFPNLITSLVPFIYHLRVSTPYPFLPVFCFPKNNYNLHAVCLIYSCIYHLFPSTIKLGIPPHLFCFLALFLKPRKVIGTKKNSAYLPNE